MDNPVAAFDHLVTATVGGANTDEYYAKVYANEQNNVPTQTLVIPAPAGAATTQQPVGQQRPSYTNQLPPDAPQQRGESALDYFLRTSAGEQSTTPQQPQLPQQQVQQQVQQPLQPTQPVQDTTYTNTLGARATPDVSPTNVGGFLLHAAFSAAVVLSVVGIMFIVYVIIRTRQLHHHEHHVKELGGHGGHGTEHSAGHGHAAPSDPHASVTTAQHREHDAHHAPIATAAAVAAPVVAHAAHHTEEPADMSAFASRLASIQEEAQSDNEDGWFSALMDINLLLEDVLTEKKFEGSTVKEMLHSDEAKHLATRDVGLEAEAQFQKLISGEMAVTQESIQRLVAMYAKVCKEVGVV